MVEEVVSATTSAKLPETAPPSETGTDANGASHSSALTMYSIRERTAPKDSENIPSALVVAEATAPQGKAAR